MGKNSHEKQTSWNFWNKQTVMEFHHDWNVSLTVQFFKKHMQIFLF